MVKAISSALECSHVLLVFRLFRATIIDLTTHPADDDSVINFVADVPHLLTNRRSAFLEHIIELSSFIVDKYKLPTAYVSLNFTVQVYKLNFLFLFATTVINLSASY